MNVRSVVIFALPALIAFFVFALLGFVWWPFWLFALPVAIGVIWLLEQRAEHVVLNRLGARPLGEKEGERISNTVESLCLQSGIDQPDLYVIDSPTSNLASLSTRSGPLLVATTGLLSSLSVMEMEGVVAHGLSKLRSGDTTSETLAMSVAPLITGFQRNKVREWGLGEGGVLSYDIAGVGMTRYPPGLRSALERIHGQSTDIAGAESLGAAWLVPPANMRVPLDHRIEVLWEL